MPKKENLLNQVFSRLQVIDSAPSKNGKTYWLCKCACGNTCITRADQLKSGRTKSCGCLNKEQQLSLGKHNIQDITNQKFGHLTAIKRLNSRQSTALGYDWLCQCDCGNSTIVSITHLKSGNNLSCGCAKESVGEHMIQILLQKENISYIQQKTFTSLRSVKEKPLYFDFYLPQLNCLIEFDGPQHYTNTNYTTPDLLRNDCLKNQWCLENSIPLYRIPYYTLSKISTWSLQDLLSPQFQVTTIDYYQRVHDTQRI